MDRKTLAAAASDARLVLRYTRKWLQYGWIGFTILCAAIAAVRGAVSR